MEPARSLHLFTMIWLRLTKDRLIFFTVDFEKEKKLVAELGIIEVPSILFFRSGRVVDHAAGLTSKNILISKIENALIPNQN